MFLCLFVVGVLCLSALIAEKGNQNQIGQDDEDDDSEKNSDDADDEFENKDLEDENEKIISNKKLENLQITHENKNRTRVRDGNFSVDCDCNLTKEKENNKTKLKMKLSSGKNSEIKIMPETASIIAIQKLMIKNCAPENNCTIILKEVGKNETAKAVYEMQIEKQVRILGMFKTKVQARAEVDVETGEIKIKKPWWAKLVDEKE